MTKARLLLIAVLLVACVCLTAGGLAILSQSNRHGITKANFDRVKKGMTIAEVEDVYAQPHEVHEIRHKAWVGDFGVATIFFDEDTRITAKYWESTSYLTRLRRMFR